MNPTKCTTCLHDEKRHIGDKCIPWDAMGNHREPMTPCACPAFTSSERAEGWAKMQKAAATYTEAELDALGDHDTSSGEDKTVPYKHDHFPGGQDCPACEYYAAEEALLNKDGSDSDTTADAMSEPVASESNQCVCGHNEADHKVMADRACWYEGVNGWGCGCPKFQPSHSEGESDQWIDCPYCGKKTMADEVEDCPLANSSVSRGRESLPESGNGETDTVEDRVWKICDEHIRDAVARYKAVHQIQTLIEDAESNARRESAKLVLTHIQLHLQDANAGDLMTYIVKRIEELKGESA